MTISRSRSPTQSGFTLLEMMITVAIAAALGAAAVPSLGTFVKNSAMRSHALELMGSIAMARSEAIKRGSRVILCRTVNPNAATPVCGGSDRDWASGWLVYVVEDADSDFDLGTDILIDVGQPAPEQIVVTSNGSGNNYLVFQGDGTLDESGTARYAFCDDRGEAYGRQLSVALVGRPALQQGSSASPIANCTPAG